MNLCLAILGPTASGKSAFAVNLAEKLNGEIVCLDSSTVYRELDIGTSKPSLEDQTKVPHHLLDLLNPSESFSAYHFVEEAERAIEGIQARGKLPLVVGGTYFYMRALQHGMYPNTLVPPQILEAIESEFGEDESLDSTRLHAELKKVDPEAALRIHPNDRYRLVRALGIWKTSQTKTSELRPEQLSDRQATRIWMKYAMLVSRRELNNAIVRRSEGMLAGGLIDEVKKLNAKYPQGRALSCIGYAEGVRFLNREITDKQLRNEIIEKTRRLAKRQVTWLRSDPEVRYIDKRDLGRVVLEVENLTFALETPP